MAEQRPLVIIEGLVQQLPDGDTTPGVGGSGVENFSYNKVVNVVTIPVNQQMSVYQSLEVDGILNINGAVIIYE